VDGQQLSERAVKIGCQPDAQLVRRIHCHVHIGITQPLLDWLRSAEVEALAKWVAAVDHQC
jgi:hypothetical protein